MIHAQLRGGPFDERIVTVYPANSLKFPIEGFDCHGRARTAIYKCCADSRNIYEYKGFEVDYRSLISVKLVGGPQDGETHAIHPGQRFLECEAKSFARIAERNVAPTTKAKRGRYEMSFEDPNIFQWMGWT
jgi:hypothetical protein